MAVDIPLLIRQCIEIGATDLVLTPGPLEGRISIRRADERLHTQNVPWAAYEVMCEEIATQSHMAWIFEEPDAGLPVRIGSLNLGDDLHARVTITLLRDGPMVRLRLQRRQMLRDAARAFQAGELGGLGVLSVVSQPRGLVLIAGPPSSGKTSALHHVLQGLGARPTWLMSEAAEMDLGSHVRRILPGEVQHGTEGVVWALDEMDESTKLQFALDQAADHLVLATTTTPRLAQAFQRLRAGLAIQPVPVLGFLCVGWDEQHAPRFRWMCLNPDLRGCPRCRPEPYGVPCPRCGTEFIDPSWLERLDDLTVFQKVAALS